jgi:hypothetical protein
MFKDFKVGPFDIPPIMALSLMFVSMISCTMSHNNAQELSRLIFCMLVC